MKIAVIPSEQFDPLGQTGHDMPALTPLPWEYDPSKKYYRTPVIRHNGVVVAKVVEQTSPLGDTTQNGELLSAAGDLYNALGCALDDYYCSDREKSDWIDLAEAAMAKAGCGWRRKYYEERHS